MNIEKILGFLKKILIFLSMFVILILAMIPMQVFAHKENFSDYGHVLAILNLFVVLALVVISNKIEKNAIKEEGYFLKRKKKFHGNGYLQ